MGRKSLKKTNKLFGSNMIKSKNNLYVNNIQLKDVSNLFESGNSEHTPHIILNMVVAGVSTFIMSQLTISARPEGPEYTDQLQSYKDIKRRVIISTPGRTLAAVIGLASAFPYMLGDIKMKGEDIAIGLGLITVEMVESQAPNTKRIKPSTADWQSYAKGEMGAATGQLLSCPSTNLKTLNIDGQNVQNYNLEDAIDAIGIEKETLQKYNITPERVTNEFKSIFLVDNSGMPIYKIEYDEPQTIYSKIQADIFGDTLIRSGKMNSSLIKGLEPESPITKTQIEKHLDKYELIAYNFAIKSGDKNILRKYTDIVKERARSEKSLG